jgi:hypothetical protein
MGWANEMLNPIRQGAAAREMAGQAVNAAQQGQLGKMAGMAALTAMAVPGVPGGNVPRPFGAKISDVLEEMKQYADELKAKTGTPVGPSMRPIDNPEWEAAWNRLSASTQGYEDARKTRWDARKTFNAAGGARDASEEARQAYADAKNRFQSSIAERRALLDELGKHERFLYVPDENPLGRWR